MRCFSQAELKQKNLTACIKSVFVFSMFGPLVAGRTSWITFILSHWLVAHLCLELVLLRFSGLNCARLVPE